MALTAAFTAYLGAVATAFRTLGGIKSSPVPDFTFVATLLEVAFTNTTTDADSDVASQEWSFGDDETSTAASPTHTYAAAGSYNVTLTVTDGTGNVESVNKTVTVAAT